MSADYLMLPGATPPPGVIPNFVNPESHGSVSIITSTIALGLMISFVIARFYTKLHITHKWGWDDLTCLIAVSGSITFYTILMIALSRGLGRHSWDIHLYQELDIVTIMAGVELVYSPSILAIKLSLFLLYLQVFRPNHTFRHAVYFGIAFTSLYCTAVWVTNLYLFIPRPGQSWWDAAQTPNWRHTVTSSIVESACSCFTDLYLLILPIPMVWILQMPLAKKIGIISVFLSGLLANICSAMTLGFRIHYRQMNDYTWNEVLITILPFVEICVGIMCCCMPHFAALIRHQQDSPGFIKFSIFTSCRQAHSALQNWFSSSGKSPSNQCSSEGEFLKIEHSDSEILPQIWNQNKETPSISTAILSPSARTDSQKLPVDKAIRVTSDLHQAWSPVSMSSRNDDLA